MKQTGGGNSNNIYNDIYNDIIIQDENNKIIDITKVEKYEQQLVKQHILPSDRVLELGARYGSVSVTINKILLDKKKHVAVEPDDRIWNALKLNKKNNNCKFKIFKGLVANNKYSLTNKDGWDGYATTMVPDENSDIKSITLDNLIKKYNIDFNVLIVDCEGCFELFLDENLYFIKNLRMIIYEADYVRKCNYIKIENILLHHNYKIIDVWSNQYVWKKKDSSDKTSLDEQLRILLPNRNKLKFNLFNKNKK